MFERRTARVKLAKSIEIVEAYSYRLAHFMEENFKYQLKPNNSILGLSSPGYGTNSTFGNKSRSPATHIIVIEENKLQEFTRLKNEFESEYKIAQGYADILKPQFFDDGCAAYDAKLKLTLVNHAQSHALILEMFSKFDIYTKKP